MNNPHNTTAAQVGAYTIAQVNAIRDMLLGLINAANSDLENAVNNHIANVSNPHSTTAAQVGAYTIAQVDAIRNALLVNISNSQQAVENLLNTHATNTNNPHNTTAAQVGAVPITRTVNGQQLNTNIVLTAADVSAVPTTRTVNGLSLSANITLDKNHIGLSNVDNTSDVNKPISAATQTALNGKQNVLGFNPVSTLGGTMFGPLFGHFVNSPWTLNNATASFFVNSDGANNSVASIGFQALNYAGTKLGLHTDGTFGVGGWSFNGLRWSVNMHTGNMTTVGDIQSYSDERLKTNFKPILYALEKVRLIEGVTYDRIDTMTRQAGFRAQQVEKILPEVVNASNTAERTLTLSYGNMGALYVEAIKELDRNQRRHNWYMFAMAIAVVASWIFN